MRILRTSVRVATIAAALAIAGCASAPQAFPGSATSSPAANGRHLATLAAGAQRTASLAVVSGATTIDVSAAPLPGELVRAWTPAGSGVRPQLVQSGGQIQVFLDSTGGSGANAVTIELSSAVTWRLQFSGGASQTTLQLARAKVSGIDFTAGTNLINMTLPRPGGTVVLTIAGGASQATLGVPAGVPTRLRLYGGASTATLDGQTHAGIAGGTVLTPPGWTRAANRYDVNATSGVGSVTVTG